MHALQARRSPFRPLPFLSNSLAGLTRSHWMHCCSSTVGSRRGIRGMRSAGQESEDEDLAMSQTADMGSATENRVDALSITSTSTNRRA